MAIESAPQAPPRTTGFRKLLHFGRRRPASLIAIPPPEHPPIISIPPVEPHPDVASASNLLQEELTRRTKRDREFAKEPPARMKPLAKVSTSHNFFPHRPKATREVRKSSYRATSPILKKGTYQEGDTYIIPAWNPQAVKKTESTIVTEHILTPRELGGLVGSQDQQTRMGALKIVEERLGGYGLDPKPLIRAWMSQGELFGKAIEANLSRLDELERIKPRPTISDLEDETMGISQALQEEFGICNFAQHPRDVLVNQFERKDDDSKPCGLIVYPFDDKDGEFGISQQQMELLFSTFSHDYNLRIVEASTIEHVRDRLVASYRKHKKYQRVSFVVIPGYTDQHGIRLATEGNSGRLSIDELMGKWYFQKNQNLSFVRPGGVVVVTQRGDSFDKISKEVREKMNATLVCLEDISVGDLKKMMDQGRKTTSARKPFGRRKKEK